eukprot:m.234321 g.234321  ORF g.234321 m.234321 type:complete len:65 (-) comp15255_c1_seq1:1905-2099(-)
MFVLDAVACTVVNCTSCTSPFDSMRTTTPPPSGLIVVNHDAIVNQLPLWYQLSLPASLFTTCVI